MKKYTTTVTVEASESDLLQATKVALVEGGKVTKARIVKYAKKLLLKYGWKKAQSSEEALWQAFKEEYVGLYSFKHTEEWYQTNAKALVRDLF